jgi:hypothetical protein
MHDEASSGPAEGSRLRVVRAAPAFYNVAEVAAMLRLDQSTLYRHLRDGQFPGLKIGARYVVPHIVVEKLISDILAAGKCLDLAEWTASWLAQQAESAGGAA